MRPREDWPRDESADEDTDDIPVLTDVVVLRDTAHASHWDPDDLAGLKTALVAQVHDLAEGLVHEALRELEGVLL